jgi:para-aminobenzoate synthetase
MPGGSMTGAPKLRTMQVIADVEDSPRGVYSGVLGWLGPHAADLGMVIRTLVYDGEHYTAGTGGGITVRSDVADEYAESRLKLDRVLAALGD